MTAVVRTRGDDWSGGNAITGVISVGGTPVDLTGATIAAQLRLGTEATSVAATFTVTIVDAAAGEVALSLPSETTAALKPRVYVYDLEVTIAGVTTTYGVGSQLRVSADTTRVA